MFQRFVGKPSVGNFSMEGLTDTIAAMLRASKLDLDLYLYKHRQEPLCLVSTQSFDWCDIWYTKEIRDIYPFTFSPQQVKRMFVNQTTKCLGWVDCLWFEIEWRSRTPGLLYFQNVVQGNSIHRIDICTGKPKRSSRELTLHCSWILMKSSDIGLLPMGT